MKYGVVFAAGDLAGRVPLTRVLPWQFTLGPQLSTENIKLLRVANTTACLARVSGLPDGVNSRQNDERARSREPRPRRRFGQRPETPHRKEAVTRPAIVASCCSDCDCGTQNGEEVKPLLICFSDKKTRNRNTESICKFHERANGGIPTPPLQIRDIAALNRSTLSQALL